MTFELSNEIYDLIKTKCFNYIPKVHMINGVKDNILDFYKGGKEYNYLDFYNKNILIEPRTPSLISEKNTILLETSEENTHNIEVTSTFEQINVTDFTGNTDFQWICYTEKNNDKKSSIELQTDDFKNFKNYFSIIFNFVEKGESFNSVYDFSLHIKLFFDNPLYYTSDNYLNHDNYKVIYYSKYAYKPYQEANCICDIKSLGNEDCSFKKYLSIKTKQEYMHELSDYIFDIKEKISEAEFLNMQNILLDLHKYH